MNDRATSLPISVYVAVALLASMSALLFTAWASQTITDPTLSVALGVLSIAAATGLVTRNPLGYTIAICVTVLGAIAVAFVILVSLPPELFLATYLPIQAVWWAAGLAIVLLLYAHWRKRGSLNRGIRAVAPAARAMFTALAIVGVVEAAAAAVSRTNEFQALTLFEVTLPWGLAEIGFSRISALQWAYFGVPLAAALAWAGTLLLRDPVRSLFLGPDSAESTAAPPKEPITFFAAVESETAARFAIIILPLATASLVRLIPRDTFMACIQCGPTWHFVVGVLFQVACFIVFGYFLWLNRSLIRKIALSKSPTDVLIMATACSNAAVLINLVLTSTFWLDVGGDIDLHIVVLAIEVIALTGVAIVFSRRGAPIWAFAPLLISVPSVVFSVHALSVGWYAFISPTENTCLLVFSGLHADRAFILSYLVQVIVVVNASLKARANLAFTICASVLAAVIAAYVIALSFDQLLFATDINCRATVPGFNSWTNYLWP